LTFWRASARNARISGVTRCDETTHVRSPVVLIRHSNQCPMKVSIQKIMYVSRLGQRAIDIEQ
jgi:hypothetical protein